MKRLLTSFAGGEQADFLEHTGPLMLRYARTHGYAAYLATPHGCTTMNRLMEGHGCKYDLSKRPWSWYKLPWLVRLLETERPDVLLWLDADVVVNVFHKDISDHLDGFAQGVVGHQTHHGLVPNFGVWLLTPEMIPTLLQAWDLVEHLDHPWWEQAAMIELLGGDPRQRPVVWPEEPGELLKQTMFLDHKWNWHPHDDCRPEIPAFIHVTQFKNRLDAIKQMCSHAAQRPVTRPEQFYVPL